MNWNMPCPKAQWLTWSQKSKRSSRNFAAPSSMTKNAFLKKRTNPGLPLQDGIDPVSTNRFDQIISLTGCGVLSSVFNRQSMRLSFPSRFESRLPCTHTALEVDDDCSIVDLDLALQAYA